MKLINAASGKTVEVGPYSSPGADWYLRHGWTECTSVSDDAQDPFAGTPDAPAEIVEVDGATEEPPHRTRRYRRNT